MEAINQIIKQNGKVYIEVKDFDSNIVETLTTDNHEQAKDFYSHYNCLDKTAEGPEEMLTISIN